MKLKNVTTNQRPGRPPWMTDRQNKNLVEDVENLLPVTFRKNPFSSFLEEVENIKNSYNIKTQKKIYK